MRCTCEPRVGAGLAPLHAGWSLGTDAASEVRARAECAGPREWSRAIGAEGGYPLSRVERSRIDRVGVLHAELPCAALGSGDVQPPPFAGPRGGADDDVDVAAEGGQKLHLCKYTQIWVYLHTRHIVPIACSLAWVWMNANFIAHPWRRRPSLFPGCRAPRAAAPLPAATAGSLHPGSSTSRCRGTHPGAARPRALPLAARHCRSMSARMPNCRAVDRPTPQARSAPLARNHPAPRADPGAHHRHPSPRAAADTAASPRLRLTAGRRSAATHRDRSIRSPSLPGPSQSWSSGLRRGSSGRVAPSGATVKTRCVILPDR